MKNIHLLPTDKPSKIFYIAENFHLEKGQLIEPKSYHNVYITSDEEIKEGDYFLYDGTEIRYKSNGTEYHGRALCHISGNRRYPISKSKKIILTTDPSLAPDVQKIDDEFLEWFVKNPSCEEVKVERTVNDYWKKLQLHYEFKYEIIIPQEESKQETLEEAAEKYAEPFDNRFWVSATFKDGAKWQAKRMYSDEEVKEIIKLSCEKGMLIQRTINDKVKIPYTRIKDFTIKMLEQFKKK